MNGANVAAVLFFPLAAVGNFMDADKAEQLIDQRRYKLAAMYDQKRCGPPPPVLPPPPGS